MFKSAIGYFTDYSLVFPHNRFEHCYKMRRDLVSNQMILICFRLWPHFILLFIFLFGCVLRDYINASASLLQNSTSWVVFYADVICIYDINYQLFMRGDARWYSLVIREGLLPRHRQAFAYSTTSYPVLVCLAVRIVMTDTPQDVHFTLGLEEVRFHCEASSDDNTPVNITWEKDNVSINMATNTRITINSTELIIDLIGLSTNDIETNYIGEYMCIASDGYTIAKAKATFKHGKLLWNWFPCRILW